MLLAELKGKIPSVLQNYEDILTSSVIGIFQYLSSPIYIQSVLETCVNINGNYLTFTTPVKECGYDFWPKLENSEPDVLLSVHDEEENEYLICIGAKYWSDKSSNEDQSIEIQQRSNGQRDQLAREIEDIHNDSCIQLMNVNKGKLNNTILIYLTNDTYIPSKEMLESIIHVHGIDFSKEQLFWLSWREIHKIISNLKKYKTLQDLKLLSDLKRLLERKGLQSFSGFQHHIEVASPIYSKYSTEINSFSWSYIKELEALKWNYGGIQNG